MFCLPSGLETLSNTFLFPVNVI